MTLTTVAAGLYALPPHEFTAARDAQAAAAKQAGDDSLAASIKRLRRPSTSAALLNGLVREDAKHVDDLLAVGEQLRAAQAAAAGDDLRALMRARQQLTTTLVRAAENLASGLGVRFTVAVQREIQATLLAALSDSAAEQALRSGCLISGLNYAGFGDDADPALSRPNKRDSAAERRRRELHERAATARRTATERGDELRDAQAELAQLDERLAEQTRELQQLQQRRDRANHRLTAAQQAHAAAIRKAEQADEQAAGSD
jgi:hypothetical protein